MKVITTILAAASILMCPARGLAEGAICIKALIRNPGDKMYYCSYVCSSPGSDSVSCMSIDAPFEDCLGLEPVSPFEIEDYPERVKTDYDAKCETKGEGRSCVTTCTSQGEVICENPCPNDA